MRRALLLAVVLLLALPGLAGAATNGGVEAGTDPGGAAYDPGAPLRIRSFRPTVAAVSLRVDGPVGRVRISVDVLDAASRKVVDRVRLGSRRTGRALRVAWRPELAPGDYLARLDARTADGRRARRTGRTHLTVAAPKPKPKPAPAATPPPAPPAPAPAPAPAGRFPVQGPYAFGGADASFGAGRTGHSHQGQDLIAAEGTPVVSPVPGVVHWRAYQGDGAGHYLVIRSPGLGDHAYMHLREGSLTVAKGAAVAAGQRIAEVGTSGASSGPHLHFELWPAGWWEPGSAPVDPRPQLEAWAAGR